MKLILLLVLAVVIPSALSHSWVGCVDYQLTPGARNSQYYDNSVCKGFPRNYKNGHFAGGVWGGQTGYNFQPSGANVCKYPNGGASNYDASFPMASYVPGENICIAWSPQNHVAATCANVFIPDHGTKIYVSSGANPTADAATGNMRLVKDFGRNMKADEGVGFQNCPKFCENNVGALCYGCFTVPSDLRVGSTYTFVWTWAFNGPTDIYSTCWEAKIVSSKSGSTPPTPTPPTPTPKPPTPTPPTPTPQTPPTPTPKPPTPTTPSGGKVDCSKVVHAHTPTNLWWVEVAGLSQSDSIKVKCSGRSSDLECTWLPNPGKFQCIVPATPCNHPRQVVTAAGQTCNLAQDSFKALAVGDIDAEAAVFDAAVEDVASAVVADDVAAAVENVAADVVIFDDIVFPDSVVVEETVAAQDDTLATLDAAQATMEEAQATLEEAVLASSDSDSDSEVVSYDAVVSDEAAAMIAQSEAYYAQDAADLAYAQAAMAVEDSYATMDAAQATVESDMAVEDSYATIDAAQATVESDMAVGEEAFAVDEAAAMMAEAEAYYAQDEADLAVAQAVSDADAEEDGATADDDDDEEDGATADDDDDDADAEEDGAVGDDVSFAVEELPATASTPAASESIPAWGIALIVVGSVLLLANIAATIFLAKKTHASL